MPLITKKVRIQKEDTYIMLEAEIVFGCGGVIALHLGLENNKSCQLTHTLTGYGLLKQGTSKIYKLKECRKLAREFWESLPEKAKEIWRTSDNRTIVARCIPQSSVKILRETE